MKSEKKCKIKKLKNVNRVLLRYFLLLAVLIIVLLEFTCYVIVSNTTEAQARDRVARVGNDISVKLKTQDDFMGYYKLSAEIRTYLTEGISVYFLSGDGSVILPINDGSENNDFTQELNGVKERLKNADANAAIIYSENYVLKYAAEIDAPVGRGYLIVSYSMMMTKIVMRFLILYLVIVGILVLLVAVFFSFSASQKLSSGLRQLSSTAVRFSQGDYNVSFANAEYQELADLSDTLNSVRDEVKKSGDFQRELLANVSHDLKTPLTMIKAYASMIREISGDNPEKRDKHLQVIIDEADRLTGLVNDVLNVSKVTSNLEEINFKVFNLTEFLYGIINKFEYLQETQGYKIMVDIDANLYTRADEEKIGQVIYNLLGNAVNYTGDDKTVYISLKKDLTGDRIKLRIRDTGKGISKEDLPDIWNRYYRAKENHSRPVKGTGLGLNIVKIILENHSFDYGVESEPGKGSTFWVDFPSVPENAEEDSDAVQT